MGVANVAGGIVGAAIAGDRAAGVLDWCLAMWVKRYQVGFVLGSAPFEHGHLQVSRAGQLMGLAGSLGQAVWRFPWWLTLASSM